MKTSLFNTLMVISLFFASCATRIPFTQAIKEQYQLNEEDMKKIQFYASSDIVLQRGEVTDKSVGTDQGKLKVTDGKSVEEVLIRAGTPGVVEKVIDANRVAVSFENKEGAFIIFGDPYDKKGRYTLLAADWENNRGKLEYMGKTYYAAQGTSNVYLTFYLQKLNKYKKQQHVATGKKL
jgi:hypothetical protein